MYIQSIHGQELFTSVQEFFTDFSCSFWFGKYCQETWCSSSEVLCRTGCFHVPFCFIYRRESVLIIAHTHTHARLMLWTGAWCTYRPACVSCMVSPRCTQFCLKLSSMHCNTGQCISFMLVSLLLSVLSSPCVCVCVTEISSISNGCDLWNDTVTLWDSRDQAYTVA